MDGLSIYLLLDYLYNKFAVTFILSIMGVSIREVVGNVNKKRRVKISRVLITAFFATVIMCAIGDLFSMGFSLYVLVSIIMGMWSSKLISLTLNNNFVMVLIQNLLKVLGTPLTKSIADAVEEQLDTKDKETTEAEINDATKD